MNTIALLYHDVVPSGKFDASGFPGVEADIYKLEQREFDRHLDALALSNGRFILTFDDGGASFYDVIAPALEEQGWLGYFFIATNWIGKPGFLTVAQLRELRKRGHLIGSHSCSHPARISSCSFDQIHREWTESMARLTDILGEQIQMASVPGGYYSAKVAKAAAAAGIRTLFTSEPTIKAERVEQCVVVGRFTIRQGTSAATAAALARSEFLPRVQQSALWNTKKALKAVGGEAWLKVRKRVLEFKTAS